MEVWRASKQPPKTRPGHMVWHMVSDPAQAEEGVEGLQRVALRDLGQGPRTDKMSQKVSSLVSYGQSSAKPPWRDNIAFLQSASLCLTTLLALPQEFTY